MNYRSNSQRDFVTGLDRGSRHGCTWTRLHWLLLAGLPIAGLLVLSLSSNDANALRIKETALALPEAASSQPAEAVDHSGDIAPGRATGAVAANTSEETARDTGEASPAQPEAAQSQPDWKTVKVKKGDSLAKIFAAEKLSPSQLHAVLNSGPIAKKLTRIYPGQELAFLIDPDKGLLELRYDLDALNTVQVRRNDDSYEAQLIVEVAERRTTSTAGTIENSLFMAAQEAGLPEKITMELANIFGWDIDFALDIRSGDQFAVVYEELFLNGEKIGLGNIIAAEFTNRGKTHQALRFADSKGDAAYYAPNGRSMRKAFIRTPVSFARISSRFSLGRKHPILNRIRAHKGVDYAAPRGTAVKATGNGKIVYLGRKGGYGKTVVIKHGTKYSTLYAHLSRYKRGLKKGNRVQQGQIIGYVGSTGLATGPHLHYEFLVNGVHRNPLTVKLPSASPLPKKYREDFKQVTETSLALLELAKNEAVALRN